jgi:hypothetical protein
MNAGRRRFIVASTSLSLLTAVAPLRAFAAEQKKAVDELDTGIVLIASQSLSASAWVKACTRTMGKACGDTDATSAWLDRPEAIAQVLGQLSGRRVLLLLDDRDHVVLHMGLRDLQAAVLWEGRHGNAHDPSALAEWLMAVATVPTNAYDRTRARARFDEAKLSPLDQPVVSLVAQL